MRTMSKLAVILMVVLAVMLTVSTQLVGSCIGGSTHINPC